MPELPDVEIFKRRLDHAATGRRITDVSLKDARLLGGISARELERRLVGRRIRRTERHGKHLIAELDDRSACGTLLATLRSGGRTGYFCPGCQPRWAARR